jgi:hypothetical protein
MKYLRLAGYYCDTCSAFFWRKPEDGGDCPYGGIVLDHRFKKVGTYRLAVEE